MRAWMLNSCTCVSSTIENERATLCKARQEIEKKESQSQGRCAVEHVNPAILRGSYIAGVIRVLANYYIKSIGYENQSLLLQKTMTIAAIGLCMSFDLLKITICCKLSNFFIFPHARYESFSNVRRVVHLIRTKNYRFIIPQHRIKRFLCHKWNHRCTI